MIYIIHKNKFNKNMLQIFLLQKFQNQYMIHHNQKNLQLIFRLQKKQEDEICQFYKKKIHQEYSVIFLFKLNYILYSEFNYFVHFIENPELVKPITTIIDNKKLSVEFIMPEIVALQRKTSLELEAEETIPLINKVNYFLIYINIYIY